MVIKPNKLIAHVRAKGESFAHVAIKCGITESAMSKIVHGFRDPSLEVAKRIADYLGTTIDDLVT